MRRLRVVVGILVFTVLLLVSTPTHSQAVTDGSSYRHALHAALAGTPATALVLDVSTGMLLASDGPENHFHSAPGSILKPFFLAAALESGAVQPQTTIICHRNLRILGHNLSCTHPQTDVAFNAEEALAYSCNTYFADLASRLSTQQAVGVLRYYGFGQTSHSDTLRPPNTREEEQLFVLGLADIRVSLGEITAAYRKLALKFSSTSVLAPVEQGMLDSVRYGAAHNAEVPGVNIAGKTGTASDPGQAWTHGWFAGIAGNDSSRIVAVVYLPRGNGADAATIAKRFFLSLKLGHPQ